MMIARGKIKWKIKNEFLGSANCCSLRKNRSCLASNDDIVLTFLMLDKEKEKGLLGDFLQKIFDWLGQVNHQG